MKIDHERLVGVRRVQFNIVRRIENSMTTNIVHFNVAGGIEEQRHACPVASKRRELGDKLTPFIARRFDLDHDVGTKRQNTILFFR